MEKKVIDYSNYQNPSLEELMSLKGNETARIVIRSNKQNLIRQKYARIVTIFPFETVKSELLEWKNNLNLTNINDTTLKDKNPSLYHKIRSWSYALNGNYSTKQIIQKMGLNTMNERQSIDEYTENIKELFPRKFILDFLNEGKTKAQRVEYIKKASKSLRSAYEARKWRISAHGLSPSDIIDEAYPDIVKETGLLPSQILWFKPFSEDTISSLVNKLYYDGADIRSQALEQTQAGKNLLYFIRHTHNRPHMPSKGGRTNVLGSNNKRKALKSGHSQEVLKYFRQNFFNDQRVLEYYLLNDDGCKRDISCSAEIQFSLFMRILSKYDPNLENFPELSKLINTPVTYVSDPTSSVSKRLMHEKLRFSDGRFIAGGKSYLVELKTTEYSTPRQFFKSLAKYINTTHWWDGTRIDDKILVIDKSINGNARKISNDWKIIRGNEFDNLYCRALDLWYSKEPELANYSPMTNPESMIQVHELLHKKSHLLARKGYRTLRKFIEQTEMKLFNHLSVTGGLFNHCNVYNNEYSSSLNELGLYPKNLVQFIPENALFLDLETTGFRNSGSQVIMATLAERRGDDFIGNLYFARTPFEEKKVLEKVIKRIESTKELYTYNGVNFDIPLLEERSFVNLIKYSCEKKHTDLYTGYYKDIAAFEKFLRSKLKTFERNELKLDRRGDVNGSAIPEIYMNYLLGDDDDAMMHVISHNFLDVFTMPFVYLHQLGYRFDTKPVEANLQNFKNLFE